MRDRRQATGRSHSSWPRALGAVALLASIGVAPTPGLSAAPVAPVARDGAAAGSGPTLALGGRHGVFIAADGTVWTWGSNDSGQLGRSAGYGQPGVSSPTPEPVPGVANAVAVAAGVDHTLVVAADGSLWAFGAGVGGQLGIPPIDGAPGAGQWQPTQVSGLPPIDSVGAGAQLSVAVGRDGSVWTFGFNRRGSLGSSANSDLPVANPSPTAVIGLDQVVRVAVGREHVLALRSDGSLSGFGSNIDGQLGIDTNFQTYAANPTPTPISSLHGVVAVAAAGAHSVAVRVDGTVWTFGLNSLGQLGTRDTLFWRRSTPTLVPEVTAIDAAAGPTETVVLNDHGSISGFGGLLSTYQPTAFAVPVTDGPGLVVAVAVSSDETVAIDTDGVIRRSSWPATLPAVPLESWVVPAAMLPAPAPVRFPFTPVVPARLLETRLGATPTIDGRFSNGGLLPAGSITTLDVAGRGGVPADSGAAALNVTVTGPAGEGFVTVFPCDTAQPNASNLNYSAGATIPNAVITRLSASGTVCVFTSISTHVIVDVDGYFPEGARFTPINPARLLESRPAATPTIDGLFSGTGPLAAGTTTEIAVAARADVEADATSAVLNVTVTSPQADGYLTVFPCDQPRPNASSLNFLRGETIANMVVARLSATGTVCVFTTARTDLIVDVDGWFPTDAWFVPLSPARLVETRVGAQPTIDGLQSNRGRLAAGSINELIIDDRAGIAAEAAAVVLNVTVVGPGTEGYVTVFPCGGQQPTASNLNFPVGRTIANAVIAAPSRGDNVCIFTSAATDLIVDANGWVP